MKIIFEFAGGFLAIAGCLIPIWQIDILLLRAQAILGLIIIVISFLLNSYFKKWQSNISDSKKKSGLQYLINGSRVLSVAAILLLICVPILYKSIPGWAKKEAVLLLSEAKKNGDNYNLEIKYAGRAPSQKKDLFFFLSDTTMVDKGVEIAHSAEAHTIIIKLIGSPEHWLSIITALLLFSSFFMLLLTYPYKVLCNNTPKEASSQ